jgi:hypothetical protein
VVDKYSGDVVTSTEWTELPPLNSTVTPRRVLSRHSATNDCGSEIGSGDPVRACIVPALCRADGVAA